LACDFWLKALDPLSREFVLVERFCKEADRKQRLEVLQDALSGLESFIDYRAWAQTYKPKNTPQTTTAKPIEVDPGKIDRLANMKPVDPSKQEEALEKLAKIKEALQKGK
jgi:hypothetical protein